MSRLKKSARKLIVAMIGFPLIIVGLLLLVLPGPGLLVIIAGLFVLSLEFAWAERHLKTAREKSNAIVKKSKSRLGGRTQRPS